jgi:hypothetical protein
VDNGVHRFEFCALVPGEHRIVFEKRMGWKSTAEDRRVYQISAGESDATRRSSKDSSLR